MDRENKRNKHTKPDHDDHNTHAVLTLFIPARDRKGEVIRDAEMYYVPVRVRSECDGQSWLDSADLIHLMRTMLMQGNAPDHMVSILEEMHRGVALHTSKEPDTFATKEQLTRVDPNSKLGQALASMGTQVGDVPPAGNGEGAYL